MAISLATVVTYLSDKIFLIMCKFVVRIKIFQGSPEGKYFKKNYLASQNQQKHVAIFYMFQG